MKTYVLTCQVCGCRFLHKVAHRLYCSPSCYKESNCHVKEKDIKTRFAYVALFRAYAESSPWRPSKFYELNVLIKKDHIEFKGAFVRLNSKGLIYWANELKKYYAQKTEKMNKSYTGLIVEKILRGEIEK